MNRRDFIVSAIGAATMAAVPDAKSAGATWDVKPEFGLAPIKQEGATIAYDQGDRMARALARSIMQTKENVAARVLGETLDVDNEAEDGYTRRTFGIGKLITE